MKQNKDQRALCGGPENGAWLESLARGNVLERALLASYEAWVSEGRPAPHVYPNPLDPGRNSRTVWRRRALTGPYAFWKVHWVGVCCEGARGFWVHSFRNRWRAEGLYWRGP